MNEDPNPPYQIIATESDLTAFARSLSGVTRIAVDLEADSMFHFKERVCLIQMATFEANVIIDPLALPDISSLKAVFAAPSVQKIFHGADYDVRSLHRDFGIEIHNLFDTQLACRFLGCRETGLDAVIRDRFQIVLDKKYQKKNWSDRPLSPEMLAYAARDTAYLIPLTILLTEELAHKGRLEWVVEECRHLSRVRSASDDGDPLFLKFKGAGRLPLRSLAVLECLLRLRRDLAEKKDRPPFKIFSSDSIYKILKAEPLTVEDLARAKALSQKQLYMFGAEVVAAVHAAMNFPETELPSYPRHDPGPLTPKAPERIILLKRWREKQAEALAIDPALILTKSLLGAIASENPKSMEALDRISDLKEWQKQAFGPDIIRILTDRPRRRKNSK